MFANDLSTVTLQHLLLPISVIQHVSYRQQANPLLVQQELHFFSKIVGKHIFRTSVFLQCTQFLTTKCIQCHFLLAVVIGCFRTLRTVYLCIPLTSVMQSLFPNVLITQSERSEDLSYPFFHTKEKIGECCACQKMNL